MSKEFLSYINEYVFKLSDDQLEVLHRKIQSHFSDDTVDVLYEISKDKRIEYVLSTANSAQEFYKILDIISDKIAHRLRNN